jgi:hypothetical protein
MLKTRSKLAVLSLWHLSGGAKCAPICIQTSVRVGQERGKKMRFEVNGQMFFVNFVPEEGRWFCYAPTETGLQKIPVSMDASPFEAYTVDVDEQAKEVVN